MTIEQLKRLLDDALTYDIYADSLKDINDDINLNKLTQQVMDLRVKINTIENRHVKLCKTLRYVNGYSFNKIAKKMKVSYQWINKLHNKGVEELLKIYNK